MISIAESSNPSNEAEIEAALVSATAVKFVLTLVTTRFLLAGQP
jgi:hypothetical protein